MQFFDESVKPKFNPHEQDADEVYYVNFPMAGLKDDPPNNIASNYFNVTRYVCSKLAESFSPRASVHVLTTSAFHAQRDPTWYLPAVDREHQ